VIAAEPRPRPVELAHGIVAGGPGPLPVIAGPCAIESASLVLDVARRLQDLTAGLDVALIFKSSFDKANRSSIDTPRGPGLDEGLAALAAVKEATGLPILTDVHLPAQCAAAAEVVDVLQIPAFLCRQTDLIVAAAETGLPVNIKKGQFMAPEDMARAVAKAAAAGNRRVTVTERGASFGYHNLVVDMRSFRILHEHGIPVIYDVTHSLQLPGAGAGESGGDRRFAEPLALAAIAAGADGLFLEVHPDPASALSDREVQLPPDRAEALIRAALAVRRALAGVADGPGAEPTTGSGAIDLDETAGGENGEPKTEALLL
jgi:2-dehydro-3-deoxyphosphooctonate aldolase (KDO 8-P synthase)